MPVRKRKRKGLKVLNFALSLAISKRHGSEGVKGPEPRNTCMHPGCNRIHLSLSQASHLGVGECAVNALARWDFLPTAA